MGTGHHLTCGARAPEILAQALRGKLGGTVGFVRQTLGDGFLLSGASLTGASPLPPELQGLMDRLEGGEKLIAQP